MGASTGDSLTMLYPWSGSQEEKFNQILKPLVDACGIVLQPVSAGDPAQLDTLVQAGTPPDVAFVKLNQLAQYKSSLQPLTNLGVQPENYASYWQKLGTLDGNWVGLPVKVDLKTLLWYSPANFKAFGYEVPTSVAEFLSLLDKMVADGHVPFAMGLQSGDSTGKTGADEIEDIMLAEEGPDYLNFIIEGKLPYDSGGVIGFDNTPNSTGTNAYTDERLKKLAQILANASTFVPDLEEAFPSAFGTAERKAVVDWVNGGNLDADLANVAAVQAQALGK